MSSVTKRRCALGLHCVIARHRVNDHSRDDWLEIQDCDKKMRVQTLLLKAEGAAGETLHLAEDVRVELDYLAALDDDGRYRCVVMLVLVLDALSYIPYIHVFFFFCGACHSCGTHTLLTYMPPFFVRCLRRVPLLGDSGRVVHRRCGATLLARVKECVGSADGADGADGANSADGDGATADGDGAAGADGGAAGADGDALKATRAADGDAIKLSVINDGIKRLRAIDQEETIFNAMVAKGVVEVPTTQDAFISFNRDSACDATSGIKILPGGMHADTRTFCF